MNSLPLLLWDEIRGFIKSKVMIALFVGMPLITLIIHFIQPDTQDIPLSTFTGIFLASVGALIGAIMLSTSLVSELHSKVYDLFLIRPVKRWHILFAKFLSVFFCMTIASILSFAIGLLIDYFTISLQPKEAIIDALQSLVIALVPMSISCAIGILIGILIKSVALAAILAFYLGEQLSVAAILPSVLLKSINPLVFALGIGLAATILILAIEMIIFQKKQF